MKRILLQTLLFIVCGFSATAQSTYKPGYEQLKEYEGTYAYNNPATLQMAASPKDGLLYALIGDSKYPLKPYEKDVFLNSGKQEVRFIRNTGGQITGYKVKDQTPDKFYPIITKKVTFNSGMWFARGDGKKPYHWAYHIPADRHDGLPVGSIANSGLDTGLIHQLVDRVVDGTYKDIHSVLLIKDGKLILEEYFYGFNADSLHQLRSATKSFVSALVGIAINKGLLKDTSQKIAPFFKEYDLGNDPRKQQISIGNLLTQRSGLACDDDDMKSPGNETQIYPTGDWIKTILSLPMESNPGTQASYCSGNIQLLDRIIEKVSGQKLGDFARANLFGPIGVQKFDWDYAPDSTHKETFGQVDLRPRDMAKFGLLYLNHGQWNGKQVVPQAWVASTLQKQINLRDLGYSYLWWCEDLQANGKVYKGVAAKGNGGQRIFLWPDQHMMAVITAGNYNSTSPANKLLIECVLSGLH